MDEAGDDRGLRQAGLEMVWKLARHGPVALLDEAGELGYSASLRGYASKCHLCWDLRRWLFETGRGGDRLGPAIVYHP